MSRTDSLASQAQHVVVGVSGAQAQQHAVVAALVEALEAGQQQLADPVQRVGLAAPVTEGLVLGAAADLVDAAVG